MRCSSPPNTWQEVSDHGCEVGDRVARNVYSRVERSEPVPAADSGTEHDEVPSARQGCRWNDDRRGAQGRCPPLAGHPVIVDEGVGRDAVVRRIGECHVQGVARHLDRCHPRPGAKLDGLRGGADVVEAEVLGPAGERVQRPVRTTSPSLANRLSRRFGLAHKGVSQFASRKAASLVTSRRKNGPPMRGGSTGDRSRGPSIRRLAGGRTATDEAVEATGPHRALSWRGGDG